MDLDALRAKAVLVHSKPERAQPAYDDVLLHIPRNGRFARQLGPGATWFRNGRDDYFEQILSYETEPETKSPSRRTESALRRWERAESKWLKRRIEADRSLDGPWT